MRRLGIGIAAVAVLAIAIVLGMRLLPGPPVASDRVSVFYTKLDGETVVSWPVSLGSARDPQSVAFYAATQAVSGPAPDVSAIRFPPGTIVRHVDVTQPQAVVDLGGAIAQKNPDAGSFSESGEFKSLVWTMTALPNVSGVRVKIDGATVAALPGGQFELDEPLTRSSF